MSNKKIFVERRPEGDYAVRKPKETPNKYLRGAGVVLTNQDC